MATLLKDLLQQSPISRRFSSSEHQTHARKKKSHGAAQQLWFLGYNQTSRRSSSSTALLRAEGIAANHGRSLKEDDSSSDGKKKKEFSKEEEEFLKEWEWLRQELAMELHDQGRGLEESRSRQIAEACADGCAKLVMTKMRGASFDPMVVMDAMEEEVERRELRGEEFLPFEIGRKAAKLLTQRWSSVPGSRPRFFRQAFDDNKLDVVDLESFPPPPPPPLPPAC